MTPDGYEARIDLTLTDDFPLAAGDRHHFGAPGEGRSALSAVDHARVRLRAAARIAPLTGKIGYSGAGRRGRACGDRRSSAHEREMSLDRMPGSRRDGWWETAKIVVAGAGHRHGRARLPLSAVQHPVGLDEGDAAGRRLSVRLQAVLRLQPLLVPVRPRTCSRAASSPPSPSAATSSSSSCRATTRPTTSSASSACPATRSRCEDGVALHQRQGSAASVRIGEFVTREDGRPRAPHPGLRGDAAQRRQVHGARQPSRTARSTTSGPTRCRPGTTS